MPMHYLDTKLSNDVQGRDILVRRGRVLVRVGHGPRPRKHVRDWLVLVP